MGSRPRSSRRDRQEEVPRAPLDVAVLERGFHVDGLVAHLGLRLRRAHVHADAAAGAVIGCDLDTSAAAPEGPSSGTPCSRTRRARPPRTRAAKTFMRIVACGQTMAHLPQSMHTSGSQIGISLAMARFSYRAVPVGSSVDRQRASPATSRRRRPSTRPSPSARMRARHRERPMRSRDHSSPRQARTTCSMRCERRVDGREVLFDDRSPPLAVGPLDRRLDARRSPHQRGARPTTRRSTAA